MDMTAATFEVIIAYESHTGVEEEIKFVVTNMAELARTLDSLKTIKYVDGLRPDKEYGVPINRTEILVDTAGNKVIGLAMLDTESKDIPRFNRYKHFLPK